MTLLMHEHSGAPTDKAYQWDFAFIGLSLDDRGNIATKFIKNSSSVIEKVKYDAEEMQLHIGNDKHDIDDLDDKFEFVQDQKVLIEATTLSFSEILLILKHIEDKNALITILYLEPESYSRKRDEPIIHRREFELSGENLGYIPIPGFTSSFSEDVKNNVIFLAGYESERIYKGVEENPVNPNNCCLIFGVPAFQPGWEMNSFANNIQVIKEQNLSGGIHFAGANNPGATLDVLTRIHNSLGEDEELNIIPVGPKPTGIAAAIFAVREKRVNILFDHPVQKPKRSKNVKKWHLYDIKF